MQLTLRPKGGDMHLNERELATVLAALRQRQQQLELQEAVSWYDPDLTEIATNHGTFEPLSAAEIDDLCARLNAG